MNEHQNLQNSLDMVYGCLGMLCTSFSLISVHLNELQNLMYIRFCHLNLMYGTIST